MITPGAPSFTARSAVSQRFNSVSFHAPSRLKESIDHIASSGAGPRKALAAVFEPSCVAWNGSPSGRRPRTRSSHPVLSDEPGAARSISSIAEKCERLGSAMPTACTTPKSPAS